VTIGTFDGVHLGHAALLAEARRRAADLGPGTRIVALAFHPHPLTTIRPDAAPPLLTPFDHRRNLLQQAGADLVERLEPTHDLLNLTPRAFIERVVQTHSAAAFIEGPDFRFGHDRAGDVRTLASLGREIGFDTVILDPVEIDLTDQTIVRASSTMVRWLITHGRVGDAARILGRPYELIGTVIQGNQMGRTIGFPTANLETPCLIPADAVYAGAATLPDGRTLPAAIHIGTRSTFNDMRRSVEAYILDWDGHLASDPVDHPTTGPRHTYGWPLRLALIAHLRDQAKFESVPHLVAQIHRDVERTRRIFEAGPAPAHPAQQLIGSAAP
jgi:riboflavin kinase/FMN adenylyltransferase